MTPLFHDLTGERVVVVGGGTVARRRAATFAPEADVVVVAASFPADFSGVDCERRRERVTPETAPAVVADAALVVAATDDADLNDDVEAAASDAGVPVNRADEAGDVIVPATVETEHLTLAVGTGGASPSTSRYLREQLTPLLERADPMVRLQSDLREDLRGAVEDGDERRERLRAVLEDPAIWAALEDDDGRAERLARARAGLVDREE